jgi:hypothetical protein
VEKRVAVEIEPSLMKTLNTKELFETQLLIIILNGTDIG